MATADVAIRAAKYNVGFLCAFLLIIIDLVGNIYVYDKSAWRVYLNCKNYVWFCYLYHTQK